MLKADERPQELETLSMQRRDAIKLLGCGLGAAALTHAQEIASPAGISVSAMGDAARHNLNAAASREQASGFPLLTPAPRHVAWSGSALQLPVVCQIVASTGAEQQIAQILQEQMHLLHRVRARIVRRAAAGEPHILLALTSTPVGATSLQTAAGRELWHTTKDKSEAYLLEVNGNGAMVLAETPRGLVYGVQTLLQMFVGGDSPVAAQIAGAHIVDYPQLAMRGVHIVVFPTTSLETVRQEILMAARYKYNTIILEFWASLKSKKWPQTAYEHAYTHDEVRPLIELGRALQMEMVPALNSAGHQASMRAVSGEHVVLDRYPELKDLFAEENGWSLCLSNPKIYPFLFDRYEELIELFDQPKFFHVGIDEAWGSRSTPPSKRCWPREPHEMISAHLQKIHQYFSDRKIEILMWHDMFLDRKSSEHAGLSPANSTPPINSYLSLASVPKDVIIAAWNYSVTTDWPVPAYFQDKGYPVLVCVWKRRANTILLIDIAKKLNLRGMLATTWDSEAVVFPTIGQAGVLAWTAPGYDVKAIPFDHWLKSVRQIAASQGQHLPG